MGTNNIVIFGPAHVGKSTLAGFIKYKTTPNFDFNKLLSTLNYDESDKFRLLIDTHRDEITRSKNPKIGTSRYMHIERIALNGKDITVIDTPGAQHGTRERVRGMYYGEIGVFLIEISKLIGDKFLGLDNLMHFFGPLNVWFKFKGYRKLIIAISKMDEQQFSEMLFLEAVSKLNSIFSNEANISSIDIIPISINVKDEIDHNVFNKSDLMKWYSGPTLVERINEVSQYDEVSENQDSLLMFIEREFDVTGFRHIFRGKILKGSIFKGMSIKLTPVEYENNIYPYLEAKIKSIKFEKGEETFSATEGDIVGINLFDVNLNNRRIRNFDCHPTSCIINSTTSVVYGDTFQFELSGEEIAKFSLLESVNVLWFGRLVTCWVISLNRSECAEFGTIHLSLKHNKASLIIDSNNQLEHNNFMLNRNNDFINGKLLKLGVLKTINYYISDIGLVKDSSINSYFNEFSHQRHNNRLIFTQFTDSFSLLNKIKKFSRKFLQSDIININVDIAINKH